MEFWVDQIMVRGIADMTEVTETGRIPRPVSTSVTTINVFYFLTHLFGSFYI
jgi:hypothetical protein